MPKFNPQLVQHIAKLANIPLKTDEAGHLVTDFGKTLKVIDQLKEVNTSQTEPAHHVTGLENVTREDVVDEKRMFTQKEALANAPKTYQGFFVVPQIINKD